MTSFAEQDDNKKTDSGMIGIVLAAAAKLCCR